MTAPDKPPLIGRPQVYALLLLLAFAAQCLWVASRAPLDREEQAALSPGPAWEGRSASTDALQQGDAYRSPLIYRVALLPLRAGLVPRFDFAGPMYRLRLRLRLPFILFGLLYGASLWYVARRLYTNRGAYFALALYCFSPRMVAESSHVWPDGLAGWGFFGAIFLGIASAHSLYALPETLPWHRRWRRPVLMGIALGVAVASQYSLWLAAPLALAFMLYLAPARRREGAAMIVAALAIAALVLMVTFRLDGIALAAAWHAAVLRPASAWNIAALLSGAWAFEVMLMIALATWLVWPRARYFGNTAALIVAMAVPLVTPAYPGEPLYRLWTPALTFLFLFVGGVFADLLETRRSRLVLILGGVLLLTDVVFGLVHLRL